MEAALNQQAARNSLSRLILLNGNTRTSAAGRAIESFGLKAANPAGVADLILNRQRRAAAG